MRDAEPQPLDYASKVNERKIKRTSHPVRGMGAMMVSLSAWLMALGYFTLGQGPEFTTIGTAVTFAALYFLLSLIGFFLSAGSVLTDFCDEGSFRFNYGYIGILASLPAAVIALVFAMH